MCVPFASFTSSNYLFLCRFVLLRGIVKCFICVIVLSCLICDSLYGWSKKISAFFSSLCVFVCMFTRKGYIISMYRSGERLHPCQMPLVSENSSWSVWLTNNWFCGFL